MTLSQGEQIDKIAIKYKMDGPLFVEGIPLYETIMALQEFHSIIDKSYIACSKNKRIYKRHRDVYAIIATEFKRGSFESDLLLCLQQTHESAAALFPLIASLNAGSIWETTKASVDFLITVARLRSEGTEPVVHIEGNNSAPILIVNGSDVAVNDLVFSAATKSEPHLKKLSSIVNQGRVDEIGALDQNGEGFRLTEREKNLFNPQTQIEKLIFQAKVNIYRYDKESSVGKLRVLDSQEIPPSEYTFKAMTPDHISFIKAMADNHVMVDVMKEVVKYQSGVEHISSLHVVSIDGYRVKSLFD